MPSPQDTQTQVELFIQGLGRKLSPPELQSARQIVAILGPDTAAVKLAAAFAREFSLVLSALGDDLEHPNEDTLMILRPPVLGSRLVVVTAVYYGRLLQNEHELTFAEQYFRWATEHFHVLGEQAAESMSLLLLGRILQIQERLDEAEQNYQKALVIDRVRGDTYNESVDLGLLGQVAWLRGNLEEAEQYARQALIMERREKAWQNSATTLMTLSNVAALRGQRWRARILLLESNLMRLR